VIGEQVRLADVAPTALGLLGVRHEAQPAMQGTSLASWLTGQGTRSELPAYAESLVPRLQFGWAELKAIRARGFKYVEAPRPELYDLKTDPGETRNLMLNAKSMARELRAELQELEKRFRVAEEPEPRGETIDEETARKLQSLGYVASARAASDPQLARIDPKDRIAVYRRFNEDLSRATEALDADRPDEAIRLLKPLAQEAPGNSRIHNQLGQAYLEKRDYRRAIGEFEVVLGIAPQFWQARADLAKTLVLVGEPGRAVKLLEEGLADQPRNAVLLFNLGFAHHRQEKFAAALEAYRKARKVEKNYPQLLSNISMLYLQTGQAGAAVARLEELVREEPTNSLAWNNLGLARVQAGRLDEAGLAFKTAVDLAHENVVFGKNLALWYQRVGKTDEAEAELRRLKALEGKSPRPR
jgi:Flp pilus assembly protein TadD